MTQTFRQNHIIAFFKTWKGSNRPLDLSLSDYFRAHKSLGSHDRRYIGDTIYTLVRWKSLFDQIDPTDSISLRLHLLSKQPIEEWTQEPSLTDSARHGASSYLFDKLCSAYGYKQACALATALNTPAPISIRANLLKTTREELLARWTAQFQVRPGHLAPASILFTKREPLFTLPEFKEGLFEVQDEGSQLISQLIEAKSGDRFLDFCSGSGGKTLAIAPHMKGKGEIYLHDIRPHALQEAKKRLRRAGVQNAQILEPGHPTLSKLLNKMDWVLADVPCSGSGTLRRNPEMKWKIDQEMIDRLIQEQRDIITQAIRYLKPGAKFVYATCSIFPEENEEQVEYFLKHLPIKLEKEPLRLLPSAGGCDGFFAALFRKDSPQ